MTENADMALAPEASAESIIDAVISGQTLLGDAGVTDTPRLEAEAILADLLGISRAKLLASYSQTIENRDEYFSRIRRRMRGEPFAYITGTKEFMGLSFTVDGRVLIPRPETEVLVEHIVGAMDKESAPTIIDIGSGCGCIAISLAKSFPRAFIHAIDISADALTLARQNAERHAVTRQIVFHNGDTFCPLPDSLRGSADVIVSNPPYITDEEYAALSKGIRDFEPAAALKGGADGLDIFREIALNAADYLKPGGVLAVEIGETQAETAAEIIDRVGAFSETGIVRDLSNRQRIIMGKRSK